jgi:hypothetical protein
VKSGDFPKSEYYTEFADDDEIGAVHVWVDEILTPKDGYLCRQRVEMVGEVGTNKFREFHFPMNLVLVVKEEPC